MDTIQAIFARCSIRDFSSKKVPKETIMKILEAATSSPSGGNAQPWEVFVATGATLEKIRSAYQERAAKSSPAPAGPPRGLGGPPPQPAYIQERMSLIRTERLKLLGLDPTDPASGKIFQEWGARLFGTQVLVIICMDKALANNLDLGLFIQTVYLAAQDYAVESFIAGSLCSQQDVLRKEMEIPDGLNIVTGIALGYANPDAIINTYRSPRRSINEVVRYKE